MTADFHTTVSADLGASQSELRELNRFSLHGGRALPDAGRALAVPSAAAAPALGTRDVIGGANHDSRRRIEETGELPWRSICSLNIQARDGSRWSGSGWLAGPRLVITAGHCVFIHGHGGFAASIDVVAGRNATAGPFEPVAAVRTLSVTGWTESKDARFDYGGIVLATSEGEDPLGGRAGFLGFSNLSDQDLQAGVLNLAGYPDDKLPLGSLWIDSGPVTPLNREFLHYRIDTGDSQSGSPIWRKVDDQRRVVGIHTGGSPQVNRGVRINSEVFARLLAWRQEE